ncbi:MAG: SurA N-terminal domain-containing protein, partial [Hyphomicrobium sp.]
IFDQRKKEFAKRLQEQAVDQARKSVLPTLRKDALNELIDERIKIQEAKKINAVAGDEEINKIIQSIAEKNKMNDKEFADHLKKTGADINILKARFKANMSWQEVIRRRFGSQISVSERDVDRFVEKTSNSNENKVELLIHRITLPIPSKLDQTQITLKMSKAEEFLKKGGGCEKMSAHAAMISEAKFENLGPRLPETIPEPTRTLLLNSKDGELLPPIMAADGIEIWAVCSRKDLSNNEDKRQNAQAELRQKEFEVLAKKYLNDLRQDAAIEYR